MTGYDNQVVIVGAGPVGLVAALRLADLGVACVVLEASTALAQDLRASTFHPPTLDLLDCHGFAAPLVAMGRPCPTWQIRIHETGERAEFDLSILRDDTAFPFRLQCEQHKLCTLLLTHLEGRPGVELRLGTSVERIEQDDRGVIVHATHAGRATTVTGRLVIGADGARSVVRHAAGLALHGKTYPETTVLATTDFAFEEHLAGLSNVNYVWTNAGTYSLLRLPTLWRCSLYPDEGESIDDALQPLSVERKLQRIVPRDQPYAVGEIRAYRVHMRIADDFRAGRLVLAGDAAHINSPSGGMGMNGGIHDAFALTEEIRGLWDDGDLGRLDRYTRRRRPIAADEILGQADQNRGRMQERDLAARRATFADLKATIADPARLHERLLRSSMIAGLRRSAAIA